MKQILFILCSFVAVTGLKAQHCGWDNSNIIIVDVRDIQTGNIINGLELILADSKGKPYTSEWNINDRVSFIPRSDTLKFGQNVRSKGQKFSEVWGPFPFGEGYYMLRVYYNNYPEFNKKGTDQIIIRDIDGNRNLGDFETAYVTFSPQNIVPLCMDTPIWHRKGFVDEIKITVFMKLKEKSE